MLFEAIKPFHDPTLAARIEQAKEAWHAKAQAIVDAALDKNALDSANKRLAALNKHLKSEIKAINASKIIDTESVDLPEIELPEPEDNSDLAQNPLIDSNWTFYSQCQRLIDSKQYKKLSQPEYE
jgi:hypothetical protein